MRAWQIQEAKARFSEMLRESERAGPQAITSHGEEVAVVVCKADYERLTHTDTSLVDFMQRSPLFDAEEVDLTRDPGQTRDVSL